MLKLTDLQKQKMDSFSSTITLSALSTVLVAEEKTFFTAFGTRDAAMMNGSSFNKLRFSCDKNPLSRMISIFGMSFLMLSTVLFRVTASGMLPL